MFNPLAQLLELTCNTVPAFTDEFSTRYNISNLVYDYDTQLATATLATPAQIINLQNTIALSGDNSFTITDVSFRVDVTSATWDNFLFLIIKVNCNLNIPINSVITLSGFLPIEYNTNWIIKDQLGLGTFQIALQNQQNAGTLLTQPAITQYGSFPTTTTGCGYNGLVNITITDSINGIFTYPLSPTLGISLPTVSNGGLVGYIKDYTNNIIIGDPVNSPNAENASMLILSTQDYSVITNQEIMNTTDYPAMLHSATGYMIRNENKFYVYYIINTTNTSMRSHLLDQGLNMGTILNKAISGNNLTSCISGRPMSSLIMISSPKQTFSQERGINNGFQYEFSCVDITDNQNITNTATADKYNINQVNSNIMPQNNTSVIVY